MMAEDDDLSGFEILEDQTAATGAAEQDLDFGFDAPDQGLPIGGSDNLLMSEVPAAIADVGQEPIADLDSMPADDQIEELDLVDVEIKDDQAVSDDDPPPQFDELEFDSEPLNVGDLGGENDADEEMLTFDEVDSPESEAKPLTGDGGFVADSDSLKLTPDPVTGEPVFNPSADDGEELSLEPLRDEDPFGLDDLK